MNVFLDWSRKYGSSHDIILWQEGSTAVKTKDNILVTQKDAVLRNVPTDNGIGSFVPLVRSEIDQIILSIDDIPLEQLERKIASTKENITDGIMPEEYSIFHAILPQKYTLLVSPTIIKAVVASKEGKKLVSKLFRESAVWIDDNNIKNQAASLIKALADKEKSNLVFISHLGLLIGGDTTADIDEKLSNTIKKLEGEITRQSFDYKTESKEALTLLPAFRMLAMGESDIPGIALFATNENITSLTNDPTRLKLYNKPFSAGQAQSQTSPPLVVGEDDDYKKAFLEHKNAYGTAPSIVLVKNIGLVALGNTYKQTVAVRDFFLQAMEVEELANQIGGLILPKHLNFTKTDEKTTGRMAGRIAVVTGGAQGFGEGIATGIIKEGGNVIIADLNVEGAEETADKLNSHFGFGSASAVQADVSKDESVQAMVEHAVLTYGGLDLMVSNAGIAIAGDLTEMDKRSFELVTAVNYTGYFLCAKYASIPMKIQHDYKPDFWMDIIEINSKSGLVGSNKNFAYAGSKFGGIGLTQSFALELAEHGIKVNAICPGNLLDGPLWSDPENGLFVQYLEAGKVEGATSVEEVRRHYEKQVPMNRGCYVDDVAKAVFYLVEQKYETGQALPVSGGQVMLK